MPFKALSKKNNKPIIAYWFKNSAILRAKYPEGFYCPVCKGELRARGGETPASRRPHFFHRVRSENCPLDRIKENNFGDNLVFHELGKSAIYSYLTKQYEYQISKEGWFIDIEHYNPSIPERVADLAVIDGDQELYQVYEIQLSKIPITKLEERTDSYESRNVEVHWWFGKGCDCEEIRLWSKRRFGQFNLVVFDFYSCESEIFSVTPDNRDSSEDEEDERF